MSKVKLKDYDGDLDRENFELIAKIVWLLESQALWDYDDTYTFPDGETWGRFDPEGANK